MAKDFEVSERLYRIVDAIYRLHRDLFEIENAISRNAQMHFRLQRIRDNGRMGTFVAALLAILPIMISLGDIKWGSAPAVTIYCLAGSVMALWVYQVASAGKVQEELSKYTSPGSTESLEARVDFILEETNAWVVRHRLIDGILQELNLAEAMAENKEEKDSLTAKRRRYEEISLGCEQYVMNLIERSKRLVQERVRSESEHKELLDWASAIPNIESKLKDIPEV